MKEQDLYLQSDKLIATHYGEDYENYYNAIVPPVFMTSLHVFDTIDEYYDFDRRDKHKFCYGRVQNPTVRILEDKIGAMEHAVGAMAFASGMAAATTAVLTACKAGSHVICLYNAYGPLKDFLTKYCKEHMDITTTFVQGNDIKEFEDCITDKTDLIVLESPSSLVFSIQDIGAVSELAKKHDALVYIDNTYCTSIYQQPLDLGADIVMHTTSKYIGGHSDVIGGILAVKDQSLFDRLIANRELLGGVLGPQEAWLMIRGLRTMRVRIEEHQRTAMQVATFLENHPKVVKVNYTGLDSHPQKELIQKQQTGSTGLLSFEIDGDLEATRTVVESLKIFKIGVSWGGFESLVFPPHFRVDPEACKVLGGPQTIIRIHCGLEGADALISDLESALAQI